MFKAAGITAVLFLFAGLANAQVPSGNVFFGYSYESTNTSAFGPNLITSTVTRPNLNGWEASFEGKVLPWIGIVGDVAGITVRRTSPKPPRTAWSQQTSQAMSRSISSARGSPYPWASFTPFAEAFVGVAHIHTGGTLPTPSNTSFAYAVGGGLDYKIIRPIALRVEGDYVRTSFFSTNQNNFRLGVGVVVRF